MNLQKKTEIFFSSFWEFTIFSNHYLESNYATSKQLLFLASQFKSTPLKFPSSNVISSKWLFWWWYHWLFWLESKEFVSNWRRMVVVCMWIIKEFKYFQCPLLWKSLSKYVGFRMNHILPTNVTILDTLRVTKTLIFDSRSPMSIESEQER